MPNHLLIASSTLLFLTLSACGGDVVAPEDPSCPSGDIAQAMFFPATNTALPPVHLDAMCLDAAPFVDASGRAACVVIVARHATGAPSCKESDGLTDVSPEHEWALEHLVPGVNPHADEWNSFCEVAQLDPASAGGQGCRNNESAASFDESGNPARGFCYIDGVKDPQAGSAKVVTRCPDNVRRILRFTESAETYDTAEDKSLIVVCSTQACPAAL